MDAVIAVGAGLLTLTAGGECLVRGAAALAARSGVPPVVIGLTVVAFGTSAPELAVALQSVHAGAADVALGNVVGSNIFNILVILGSAALFAPLPVAPRLVRIDLPVVIGVSVLTLALASDGRVSVLDGVALLGLGGFYAVRLLRGGRTALPDPALPAAGASSAVAGLFVLAGLVLLILGADWLVDGAVVLARRFGVSDVVIGLTIVAAGTSLPELAASVIATMRGQREMAIGNVLGSNVFNLTLILGTTAVTAGGLAVTPRIARFDLVVMTAAAVVCVPVFCAGASISRWEGGLFAGYYVAYTVYLVLEATVPHAAAPFGLVVLYVALPVTLVVLAWRSARAAVSRARAGR